MVIAQQAVGQIARYVEVEVIEIGILIPHILQHILHQQAVRGVVVAVDKPRRKHVGLRVVPRYYILLRKFEHLLLYVQILKSVRNYLKSRVGIVLVTPSFLKRVKGEGVADKELSALLARDLLVPIVHNTSFEDLREVSPLLGSRSGLSTIEDSMEEVAAKIAELVTL